MDTMVRLADLIAVRFDDLDRSERRYIRHRGHVVDIEALPRDLVARYGLAV